MYIINANKYTMKKRDIKTDIQYYKNNYEK